MTLDKLSLAKMIHLGNRKILSAKTPEERQKYDSELWNNWDWYSVYHEDKEIK